MTTAVDTNALVALLYEDDHADRSEAALRRAYREGRVVVSSIVYAELATDGHFETRSGLDQFLEDLSIQVLTPSRDALFLAGEQFDQYLERRPDGLQCPSCGTERAVACPDCGHSLEPRQHVAADFVIGGHATADADGLVTFDDAFYGTYFPSLAVHPD